MLLIDPRVGSADLLEPLRKLGVQAELVPMDSADVAFQGRGAKDVPVDVGIELKRAHDLGASLRSGRLQGDQLVKMTRTYDYRWLLIEGEWTVSPQGRVLVWSGHKRTKPMSGGWTADELEKRLITLELRSHFDEEGNQIAHEPLRIHRTMSRYQTLAFLVALYRWWTDKSMDAHRSHLTIYRAPAFAPIGQFRETATTLPGVGLQVSKVAREHFRSLRRAFNASESEWAGLATTDRAGKTKKVGMQNARKIVEAITDEAV